MNIRRILKNCAIIGMLTFSSLCYAGERELVSCESVPGFPNSISYVKIHMNSIKPTKNPYGDKAFSYVKEVHTLNTEYQEKHIGTLLYVQVNFTANMAKTTLLKTVDYEKKEVLYPNTSFGWLEINPQNKELVYISDNYERYITRGTIGDNFRPYDDNLTNETVF